MPTSQSFVYFLSISLYPVPTGLGLWSQSEPAATSAPSSLEHRCSSLPRGYAEKNFLNFSIGHQNKLLIKIKTLKKPKYYKSIEMIEFPEYNVC